MLLAAGCGGSSQTVAPELSDVHGIRDLAARVDAAAGKPRLVLLLSPT
jgi:hypothetical protein